MPMVSYAQNAEDVLLRRVFPGGTTGFYLDVGANDPVYQSVTKHFYESGWRGINVEPEADAFTRLRADRPRDVNLNVGLSDRRGSLTFYEAAASLGWSTFSPAQAEEMRRRGFEVVERPVPVTTLAEVCAAHVDGPIDFLKVDAEGHEREVLQGGDWTRWRPRVVLVEDNLRDQWEGLLLGADYLFAATDGINRYYLRQEDRRLRTALEAPVSVLDDFLPYKYHRIIEERGLANDALHRAVDELRGMVEERGRAIDALRARLAPYEALDPASVDVARWLTRQIHRLPWVAAAARRGTPGA
jgi:FkbM family methyltransferase